MKPMSMECLGCHMCAHMRAGLATPGDLAHVALAAVIATPPCSTAQPGVLTARTLREAGRGQHAHPELRGAPPTSLCRGRMPAGSVIFLCCTKLHPSPARSNKQHGLALQGMPSCRIPWLLRLMSPALGGESPCCAQSCRGTQQQARACCISAQSQPRCHADTPTGAC